MKCNRCDFESDSPRLIEIHNEATHEQDMIAEIASEIRQREKGRKDGE